MTYAAVSSYGGVGLRRAREGQRPALLVLAIAAMTMATGACAQSDHAKAATDRTATPQTVYGRIGDAKPGDTVLLSAGDYGALSLGRRKFAAPGITIQPAPGAKATFSAIEIGDSEGITIKGAEVDIHGVNFGVFVGNSSRITLAGLKIHAPAGAAPSAMMLRHSNNVAVEDCDIQSVGMGINLLESDHLKILRNSFSNLQVDAIRGSASYVEVVGNHATGFHPQEGDHPDFIQFWGAGPSEPNRSNVIRDNVYRRGDGAPVQGVFIEDNDDVVISGNALSGSMYNGISMARVRRGLVEGNFIQGYNDMGSRIITRGQSSEITIRNNVAQEIVDYKEDGKPNPGYKEEHNKGIGSAKVGDTAALDAWLAKKPAP